MTEYKEIPLTQGKVAIVDAEDYHWISERSWYYHSGGYAASKNPKTKKIEYMHRLITQAAEGFVVDHINRNGIDNRRENLRVCTHVENGRNSVSSRGKSKYKGVACSDKVGKPWFSRIYIDGKAIHLGYYATDIEAAYAYDLAAKEHYKEFALLNDVDCPDFEPFKPVETSSKHRGVYWCKQKKRWRASIRINGKQTHLGYFREELDAANAYTQAYQQLKSEVVASDE